MQNYETWYVRALWDFTLGKQSSKCPRIWTVPFCGESEMGATPSLIYHSIVATKVITASLLTNKALKGLVRLQKQISTDMESISYVRILKGKQLWEWRYSERRSDLLKYSDTLPCLYSKQRFAEYMQTKLRSFVSFHSWLFFWGTTRIQLQSKTV